MLITEELNKQAKKHKKLFETYDINEKYVHVDGKDFYMVFYRKFNKHSGFGMLSSHPNPTKEEYNTAFELLVILYNNIASFKNNAFSRAKIPMEHFEKTNLFFEKVTKEVNLSEHERKIYNHCYNGAVKIMNLHKQLKKITKDFEMKTMTKQCFTVSDLDYVQDVLAEFDYIQYTQAQIDYQLIDYYKFIKEHIKQDKMIQTLATADVKKYIDQLSDNKEKLRTEIESVSHVENMENMTMEEHMDAVKKYYLTIQDEGNKSLRKEIRYPKII
ncbi:hypothetical protein [Oceanobacillus damuensis]|uniref:hypothetical protein n=1 Tax=Oceanobacillus damuensis TaxID=937928 RepID=UPI0008309423|nr:hypothetical protein [Oceanobacillus damuensis]